jgi:pimeloyl-ACP methyl ester carboxylesterase
MHFTRQQNVRSAADLVDVKGEEAAVALDRMAHVTEFGLGLPDFDARRWRTYLPSESPEEAAQDMLDMLLDDTALKVRGFSLGPRELAEGVGRIVFSVDRSGKLDPARRFLSRSQAEAIAVAVLNELGVERLVGGGSPHALASKVLATPANSPTFSVVPSVLDLHQPMPSSLRFTMAAISGVALGSAVVMGVRQLRVQTPWGLWHFFALGPSDSAERPIVLVHGMFTTSSSMLTYAVLLSRALPSRLLLVPDLLGFDFAFSTMHPGRDPPGWSSQVEALAEAVNQLYLDLHGPTHSDGPSDVMDFVPHPRACFDWVGHSYGGWVIEELHIKYPSLVGKLVLLCPGGHGRYRRFRSEAMLMGGARPVRATLTKSLPRAMAPIATSIVVGISRSSGVVRQLLTMPSADFFTRPAKPITAPALLLWGTHDDLHSPYWGLDHAGSPPTLPIDAAGTPSKPHGPHEAPAVVASALPTFSHSAGAAALPRGRPFFTPPRMLRDFSNCVGYWIERANHALPMEASYTAAWLSARFLASPGHSALPNVPSSVRMVPDGNLRPSQGQSSPDNMLASWFCFVTKLGTTRVFRRMEAAKVLPRVSRESHL